MNVFLLCSRGPAWDTPVFMYVHRYCWHTVTQWQDKSHGRLWNCKSCLSSDWSPICITVLTESCQICCPTEDGSTGDCRRDSLSLGLPSQWRGRTDTLCVWGVMAIDLQSAFVTGQTMVIDGGWSVWWTNIIVMRDIFVITNMNAVLFVNNSIFCWKPSRVVLNWIATGGFSIIWAFCHSANHTNDITFSLRWLCSYHKGLQSNSTYNYDVSSLPIANW